MIRLATLEDAQAISNIYNKILETNPSVGWQKGVYPTLETAVQAIEASEMYVLEDEGIVAAAIFNKNQLDMYAKVDWKYEADDSQVLVLHTLVVDPNRSGHGYGKQFVQFYTHLAQDLGCSVLRIDTQAKNQAARTMYAHVGFREAGIVACEFNGIQDVQLVLLEKNVND